MTHHEHRETTEPTRPDAPARSEQAPPARDERVVVEERRGGGMGSFFGSVAKAGMWMILGVIVAVIVLLALIF